ncbi:CG11425 [Drosophila busckii]|uniref:CG11425 n=1 Tax=Drosophila busckii TaxID=30019 RepID=A0A0M4EHY0_DROBS|nr:putative phosphatidate phosphatase [Drosophila busckii]ALC44265.1 CG11425 [Drosophila busckii]
MSFDRKLDWSVLGRTQGRFVVDILLLIVLLVANAYLKKWWGKGTQRGFHCDDESLMYPYHEDTITPSILHWTTSYFPFVAVLLLELRRCWSSGSRRSQLFWPIFNIMRWYLFGHVASNMIKDMGKKTIGRLRPHFFDVCRPKLQDGGLCTDEAHRLGGVYYTSYSCQPELSGATPEMIKNLYVSFPSGHSSMAFYGLVFLAFYLQRSKLPQPSSLLRPVGQLLCIGYATFVGLSRVMDYKHHWSDVVAGSLLGALVALVVVSMAENQRRHLTSDQRYATSKSTAAAAAAADADANVESADTASSTEKEQLPHDLCVVTCHSTN